MDPAQTENLLQRDLKWKINIYIKTLISVQIPEYNSSQNINNGGKSPTSENHLIVLTARNKLEYLLNYSVNLDGLMAELRDIAQRERELC